MYECFLYGVVRDQEKKNLIKTKKKKTLYFLKSVFGKLDTLFLLFLVNTVTHLGHHQVIFDKVTFLSIIYR